MSWRIAAWRAIVVVTAIASWAAAARWAGPDYVPGPWDVGPRLREWAASGALVVHALATLRVAGLGFACGVGAGIAVPLLVAIDPRVAAALRPYIAASAGLPKYALLPLLVLWLGIDQAPILWLVGLLVFYPVFFGVEAGLRQVNPRLLSTIRVLGGSRLRAVQIGGCRVVLPFFSAALSIAVPRAVSAAVVGELLIADQGIGFLIEASRQRLDPAGLFAGVIIAAALILAAGAAVHRIEGWLLPSRSPAAPQAALPNPIAGATPSTMTHSRLERVASP